LCVEMSQMTMNKVQVDHDVDVALHSLQRGSVSNIFLTNKLTMKQTGAGRSGLYAP